MQVAPVRSEPSVGATLSATLGQFLKKQWQGLLVSRACVPGMLFALRGDVEFTWTAGDADAARGLPMTEHACMPLCSLAKPLTAMTALQVCTVRGISLDVPIVDLAGDDVLDPDQWGSFDRRGVTLRRLLNHSAGFAPGSYADRALHVTPPSPAQILRGALGAKRRALVVEPPGLTFAYSNTGYTLAQEVISRVVGERLGPYARRELFAPLGVECLWFAPVPQVMENLATGRRADGSIAPVRRFLSGASSGLYGRPVDVARIFAAVVRADERRGGGVIRPDLAKDVIREYGVDAKGHRWGLGVTLSRPDGDIACQHGGWRSGWWTFIQAFPMLGVAYALSANGAQFADHARAFTAGIDRAIRQALVP